MDFGLRSLRSLGLGFWLTHAAGLALAAAPWDIVLLTPEPVTAEVHVDRGHLVAQGDVENKRSDSPAAPPSTDAPDNTTRRRLRIASDAETEPTRTLVTVRTPRSVFTFRLGDVDRTYPLYLPSLGAAVTTADDPRNYAQIATDIAQRGLRTKLQAIEDAPEESFAHAAENTRAMRIETWLGLSRDARIFRVDDHLQWIKPRFHWRESKLPETADKPIVYEFSFGRGWGLRDDVSRRLDEGVLPILRARVDDEDIAYDVTTFVSLERTPLTAETLRGTPYLVADTYGAGNMLTPAQRAEVEPLKAIEAQRSEETVLYLRGVATNHASVPRYAYFKGMTPQNVKRTEWSFRPETGASRFNSGRVFAVTRLNGRLSPYEEISVLLKPGEQATWEMYVPHTPISEERAAALANTSFERRLEECRTFWKHKLTQGAQWRLPESRIDDMVRAGLLHLDLITYGLEPDGTLIPTIGDYTAIGSESAPIIQFMDSMGWHDVARRAIAFFLDKQHDDGFMQNFNGYMLETGAVLWTMGEHYRYTRDEAWVQSVKPRLLKACRYIKAWRARNQNGPVGDGFGLLDGKTADPDDPFRSYMLNGYAYLGLSRAAELLEASDPAESRLWREEAEALKKDIRATLVGGLERAPVIPLGDGSWGQASAPWSGYRGPVMLHADGGAWFTHGTISARDALLGPLYLAFQEVIEPTGSLTGLLLVANSELMARQNVMFSQPYYSRHPYLHLVRGDTKPFIKAWYNTMAAMADRDTYTFIEHFFGASPHKTHEEAWFLMETRWMLYLEQGRTLHLLAGVPRAYLESGKQVQVTNAASYFGPLSFKVASDTDHGVIHASVECPGPHRPDRLQVRIPHPQHRPPVSVTGGTYDPATEIVTISPFTGRATVELKY